MTDWRSQDSEIECGNCGTQFFHDLNRCPNCGNPVYASEEDEFDIEENWNSESVSDTFEQLIKRFIPAASIFTGLFTSFLIATILFIAFRFIFSEGVQTWPGRGLLLLSAPFGAAAGGFAAAAMDRLSPRKMGLWVGCLSILSSVVLAGVDRDLSGDGLLNLETPILWVATAIAGYLGGEYWRRQQRDQVLRQLFPDLPDEDELYSELLSKTGNDRERVERLIEHERQFMPNATRRTLIEGALNRWERDNR